MGFFIRGIGTAVPAHTMSQLEATELAHQVICRSKQEERLLTALYRKAGVENRHTVLPHRIALNWLPEKPSQDEGAAKAVTSGPTTAERMQFFAQHAPPLALEASRRALAAADLDCREITHLITVC